MESKVKIFGHAIHPMLVVFPLGLLVSSLLFDVLYFISRNEIFAAVAFYNIAAGVAFGALAAVFGFLDLAAIPRGTRAKRIGTFHGFGNLALLVLFSMSWLFRWNAPGYEPPVLAVLFSLVGVGLGTITAWLGGELRERLAVSIHPGANLNAPSSLSDEPTSPAPTMTQVPVTGPEREIDEP